MFKKGISIFTVTTMLIIMSFSAAFAATDKEISRSIRKEISAADRDLFSQTRVSVLTKDGTVYLRGSVEHFSQISQFGQMAAMTDGVNRVVNQLDMYSSN